MSKMRKRIIIIIMEIAILLLIVGAGIYNAVTNNSFWNVTIAQLLTPLIALFFAFWATQYKNDQRKAKENAEKIILKLREIVSDDKFYVISPAEEQETKQKELNLTNRKISNYLTILSQYGKTLGFSDEVKYIETEFGKYKQTVGDHIADLEYLSKTEPEFRKISENIDAKCETIILKFYLS